LIFEIFFEFVFPLEDEIGARCMLDIRCTVLTPVVLQALSVGIVRRQLDALTDFLLISMAKDIWDYPEDGLHKTYRSKLISDKLEEARPSIKRGVALNLLFENLNSLFDVLWLDISFRIKELPGKA
jgi:hypothetical protein